MAKNDKKSAKQIIKKKKWISIFAPKTMGEAPLGESYLEDTNTVVGRTVKVNLMQVTGDIKNQNAEVKFEITGAHENKIETRLIGYYFSTSTIKRFIRRHMNRIDDSLVVLTQDGVKVRMKPFALTKSKVTRSVEHNLRLLLKEELMNTIKKTTCENLFSAVLKYQLQKDVKDKLSKIYPIKNLEIRILEEIKSPLIKETAPIVNRAVRKTKAKKEKLQEEEDMEHQKELSEEAKEPADSVEVIEEEKTE